MYQKVLPDYKNYKSIMPIAQEYQWINKYTFGVLEDGNFWLDNFFEDENVNCCDLSNVV